MLPSLGVSMPGAVGVDLGLHTALDFLGIEAAAGDGARDPRRPAGEDENVCVAPAVEATFEQQRNVVHDDLLGAGCGFAFGPEAPDFRMDDGVQFVARGAVAKDDRGECRAVETSVRIDRNGPRCGDAREPGGARGDGVARERVGVDHERTEAGEHSRDFRFSRPDAAGQPDAKAHAGYPDPSPAAYSAATGSRMGSSVTRSGSTANCSSSSGETSATCWIEPVMRRVEWLIVRRVTSIS